MQNNIRQRIIKAQTMQNNNSNRSMNGSDLFCALLAVAFIVMKITGVIDWSWVWVLAPIWIPLIVGIIVLAVLYWLKSKL